MPKTRIPPMILHPRPVLILKHVQQDIVWVIADRSVVHPAKLREQNDCDVGDHGQVDVGATE